MAKAYSDSILERMGTDLDEAFEEVRVQHEARREAALAATTRAARWAGFVRDPGYSETLVWRSVSLAQAEGAAEIAAEGPEEALATMRRLAARPDGEAARIFGHVESPTGGGEADLIDAEGCMIATSPIDKLGYYAVVAEATGESARIEIRDAQGQLAVLDGRPLDLTPGLMARRDFTPGRCGKVKPEPEDPVDHVTMPDLIGKPVKDAKAALDELGNFHISYDESHSDNAPSETVITQAPDPGRTLSLGGLVRLGISLGPESDQEMPDLVGLTEEEARKVLADLRYFAVQFTQVLDPENAGRVVEQTPKAGAPVGESTEIELCMGVAARLMPDLVGRKRKEALEVLVPDYIDAPKIREEASDGQENIVLEHDPKAGEAIGDAGVTLIISTRRKDEDDGDSLLMPELIGKTRKEALAILRRGTIEEVETIVQPYDGPEDVVIDQRPPAGEKIEADAVIVVSSAPEPPKEDEEKYPTMPDITGRTRAQALKLLKAEGIEDPDFDEAAAKRRGARVVDQSPPAGTPLKGGQGVRLEFEKPG